MPKRSFFCGLCDATVEHDAPEDSVYEGIAAAAGHFRLIHPEAYEELQRWPDGSPVVVDESIDPDDFKSDGSSTTDTEAE
jgi:hypothetical protein